ncbi:hypothetical protein C8R47DRAFT_571092 [Mycena vitilis]|nr:hypothetical protein C8R47DRAFT_571092 [Mycena vitilis]
MHPQGKVSMRGRAYRASVSLAETPARPYRRAGWGRISGMVFARRTRDVAMYQHQHAHRLNRFRQHASGHERELRRQARNVPVGRYPRTTCPARPVSAAGISREHAASKRVGAARASLPAQAWRNASPARRIRSTGRISAEIESGARGRRRRVSTVHGAASPDRLVSTGIDHARIPLQSAGGERSVSRPHQQDAYVAERAVSGAGAAAERRRGAVFDRGLHPRKVLASEVSAWCATGV